MTQAATGLRVHSGWAAAVTVGGSAEFPEILDRRVIVVADAMVKGSKQPFHAAERLPLAEAEALIGRCRQSTLALARRGLDEIGQGREIGTCGMLLASGRPLPDLPAILASHALIHTAEGEFFRDAIASACQQRILAMVRIKERELFDTCAVELKRSRAELDEQLSDWGKLLGPPWRQDEKYAALAGWLALWLFARPHLQKSGAQPLVPLHQA
jgi:hypothetical protein